MANNVFANGREINCKKGSGKSICAFPDVCWTPPDKVPPTPTGVPVPYPNTGMASDCTKGSKKVKVSGKEVILKNSSHFKKSIGDEAGVAQLKGMMTMKNRGKIYFQMWSMDVKVEGKNAVRHMDIGTHNHGSQVGNSPPWPFIDTMAPPVQIDKPCKKECPKQPTEKRKKKLRRKSPSSSIRKSINDVDPKICIACKGKTDSLAADHIVPLKIIMQMPGFACLPDEEQVKVANTRENYVGLCKSCNSSKSAKLWHTWKAHKKRGLDFTKGELAKVREQGRQVTNKSIKNLKQKIKSKECK